MSSPTPPFYYLDPLLCRRTRGLKKVLNFVAIRHFPLPSPRHASSAALNGSGSSGATNGTVIKLLWSDCGELLGVAGRFGFSEQIKRDAAKTSSSGLALCQLRTLTSTGVREH